MQAELMIHAFRRWAWFRSLGIDPWRNPGLTSSG